MPEQKKKLIDKSNPILWKLGTEFEIKEMNNTKKWNETKWKME